MAVMATSYAQIALEKEIVLLHKSMIDETTKKRHHKNLKFIFRYVGIIFQSSILILH